MLKKNLGNSGKEVVIEDYLEGEEISSTTTALSKKAFSSSSEQGKKEVLDFINDSLSGLLKPEVKEEIVGSAEIQTIFKVSKVGKVAGSKVINGEIINNLKARLIRDGNVLYTGSVGSIFREKNAAKQVAAGLECGITLKDFADYKEKDVIEVYRITETERRI